LTPFTCDPLYSKQLGARKTKEKKRVDGAFEKRKKSVKTNKKRKTTKRDGFR